MSERSESPEPSDTTVDDRDEVINEEEMDEALDQTFPASDPPPWTLGVAENRREPAEHDQKPTDK